MGLTREALIHHLDNIEHYVMLAERHGFEPDIADSRGMVMGIYQSYEILKKRNKDIENILVCGEYTDEEKLELITEIFFDL